jgi:hypothetical protein
MEEDSQPVEHVGTKCGLNLNFVQYLGGGKLRKNCLLEERRTLNEHDELVINKYSKILNKIPCASHLYQPKSGVAKHFIYNNHVHYPSEHP